MTTTQGWVKSIEFGDLPKRFDVAADEARWRPRWEELGIQRHRHDAPRSESFVIDSPPPTVSGSLHVGHIFSYTHQDIIARQRRMAGSLVTYIATSPEREEEAREGLLEELERFRNEPVTAEELAGAINYLAGQREVARQSSSSVADEILDAWLVGDGLDELLDPGRRFRSVTAEMVQDVCRRYLERDRGVEGIVRGLAAAEL